MFRLTWKYLHKTARCPILETVLFLVRVLRFWAVILRKKTCSGLKKHSAINVRKIYQPSVVQIIHFTIIICLLFCRTPSAGLFNKDKTPDFLVRYNYGPGFPTYFYSLVCQTVLRTVKLLQVCMMRLKDKKKLSCFYFSFPATFLYLRSDQSCKRRLVRKLSKLQWRLQCFFVSCCVHDHG